MGPGRKLVAFALVFVCMNSMLMPSFGKAPSIGSTCTKSANGKKIMISHKRKVQCMKAGTKFTWSLISQPGYIDDDFHYLRTVTKELVDAFALAECRMNDSRDSSSMALFFIATDFDRLDTLGPVPPGIRVRNWNPILHTYYSFMNGASDMWDAGNQMDAAARYEVVRKKTAPLLKSINKSVGTSYSLYSSNSIC